MLPRATHLAVLGVLLLAVGGLPAAQAQSIPPATFDVRAVSSTIADGATGVSLSPTLTFVLSNPLPADDILAGLGTESLDELLIEVGAATIASASINAARTEVTYDLILEPNTDYAFGFWGAEYDYNGDTTPPVEILFNFQPYAINFTTAATTGDATVEGSLVLSDEVASDIDPDFSDALVVVSGIGGGDTYLDLVETTDNQYAITVVRSGSYVVYALKTGTQVIDGVPVVAGAFGQYDPDGDGVANPITIEAGSSVTVDVTMDTFFGEVGTATDAPSAVAPAVLGPPAPHPVRTAATIPFTLDAPQPVRIAVYDLLGREVAVLADGLHAAGSHEVAFEAADLPSGLYVYRMQTARRAQTRSLVVAH